MNLSWLQKHERLLLIFAGILAVLFLANKWINHSADVAIARNGAAQQVLSTQIEANNQLKQAVTQQEDRYEKLLTAVTAQNQALVAAIASRNAVVSNQQKIDQSLPLPDLARRWEALLGLQPEDVRNTNSGLSVSDTAARSTVQQLELVPVLQQNVKDEQVLLTSRETQVTSLTELSSSLHNQVAGLNLQITDANKACQTQVAEVKAQARKSKRNWFLAGIGVGTALVLRFTGF